LLVQPIDFGELARCFFLPASALQAQGELIVYLGAVGLLTRRLLEPANTFIELSSFGEQMTERPIGVW
jgi:hypothetical protein